MWSRVAVASRALCDPRPVDARLALDTPAVAIAEAMAASWASKRPTAATNACAEAVGVFSDACEAIGNGRVDLVANAREDGEGGRGDGSCDHLRVEHGQIGLGASSTHEGNDITATVRERLDPMNDRYGRRSALRARIGHGDGKRVPGVPELGEEVGVSSAPDTGHQADTERHHRYGEAAVAVEQTLRVEPAQQRGTPGSELANREIGIDPRHP